MKKENLKKLGALLLTLSIVTSAGCHNKKNNNEENYIDYEIEQVGKDLDIKEIPEYTSNDKVLKLFDWKNIENEIRTNSKHFEKLSHDISSYKYAIASYTRDNNSYAKIVDREGNILEDLYTGYSIIKDNMILLNNCYPNTYTIFNCITGEKIVKIAESVKTAQGFIIEGNKNEEGKLEYRLLYPNGKLVFDKKVTFDKILSHSDNDYIYLNKGNNTILLNTIDNVYKVIPGTVENVYDDCVIYSNPNNNKKGVYKDGSLSLFELIPSKYDSIKLASKENEEKMFECNKENDYRPDICSLNGYYLTEENILILSCYNYDISVYDTKTRISYNGKNYVLVSSDYKKTYLDNEFIDMYTVGIRDNNDKLLNYFIVGVHEDNKAYIYDKEISLLYCCDKEEVISYLNRYSTNVYKEDPKVNKLIK